jgi:choline dehydrogenase
LHDGRTKSAGPPLLRSHLHSHIPSLNNLLRPWSGRVRVGLQYALFRRGPLSLSLNQAGGFYRSGPAARSPDMQLYIQPLSYERAPPRKRPLMSPDPFAGFSTSISPCKPQSIGHLELSSPDWRTPPALHPNYLSDPRDIDQMLQGARFLRRLVATPPLATAAKEELKPGMMTQSDEELTADIRSQAYSVFHPAGTCRMGPDPASAVVNARLRVHSVISLRVADASIFPRITSGNTNAPAIMVGEQAAHIVLRDT